MTDSIKCCAYGVMIIVVVFGIDALSIASSGDNRSDKGCDGAVVQCGHWVILRTCELLGVPLEIPRILEMLPSKERGHSMLELKRTLIQIGLATTGKRESFKRFMRGPFPAIAHIRSSHFVTVWKADEKYVYFFDGSGRSAIVRASEFQRMWDGTVLLIQRPNDVGPLPTYLKRDKLEAPCIVFDTHIIDKGQVPWNGKPLLYEFAFRNLGTQPLTIERIHTDCGCLGANKPEEPVLPGKDAAITVRYSLQEGQGPFMHHAVVRTNDPVVPLIKLIAAGNTDTKVRVTPKRANCGTIIAGNTGGTVLFVHHSGDIPLNIHGVSCRNTRVSVTYRLLTEDVAKLIWPGVRQCKGCVLNSRNTYVLHVTVETIGDDVGMTIEDSILIRTNIDGFKQIKIPIIARVVNPIAMYPNVLAFVDVNRSKEMSRTVTFVSRDGRRVRVRSIDTKDTRMKCSRSSVVDGRFSLSFATKGEVALELSGKNLEVQLEMGRKRELLTLKLPVYANLSPYVGQESGLE